MKNKLLRTTAIITFTFTASFVPNTLLANPEGGQVVGGSATITESATKLDVHQHSDRAVIDWRSFDIEVDEHTEFHQPSSSATALNRVNDMNPSRISGRLTANGNIILVNPNGVFFDGNAQVDVNGIVATTANIETDDFMAGSNTFDQPGSPNAAIVNNGHITAKEAGLVGLVAPHVENNGIIQARMGRVQLASGDTVTVDFYGDDLLKVEVSDENVKSQIAANSGILSADGGTVAMTAAAAEKTVNSLIVAGGIIGAQTIEAQDGAIIIGGDGANKTDKDGASFVAVTGVLDVSGRDEGEQGGRIEVLGDHIAVTQTALLDASGHSASAPESGPHTGSATMTTDKTLDNGVRTEDDFLAQDSRAGGSIKVGGDYLGKGDTQTAETVSVERGAVILNDAVESGDGGRTIIWSDETTEYAGLVLSRGGEDGGHGGFVETSGKINLKAEGDVDLSARDERYFKGTYLLDPANITIYGNFDPNDPTTETELWLDAADTTTLDCGTGLGNCTNTDLLQSWTDKSGNVGNDATVAGGQEPEFRTAAINGQSSIYFDGTLAIPITGALNRTNTSSSFFGVYFQESAGGNDKAIFEAAGNGDRYFLIDRRFASNSNYASVFDQTTLLNADAFGTGTAAVYRDGATVDAAYDTSGNNFDQGRVLDNYAIGDDITGGNRFQGWISEVLIYDGALSTEDRNLVEQYLATKWDIALTPDGTGATELERATASDGYSAFTTDYLERLSATADIVLLADNTITLDLQGDTLALDTNRNISMTTTNGNITDVSAGTVRTDNGNITISAGGAGDITLDTTNLEATNGGVVNMNAGGNINVNQTSDLNISLVEATSVTLESTGGSISGAGGIISNGGTIDIDASTDINFANVGLRSNNGNINLDAGQDLTLNTSTNAGTGDITATAGQDIAVNAFSNPAGLINYWEFDENAGANVTDSVSARVGNFVNDVAFDTDNPFGINGTFSLDFDGNNDQVDFGDFDEIELTDLTFSFWAKLDDLSNDEGLLYKGNHSTGQPLLIWRDNAVGSGSQAGNTDALSVLVYDGSTQDWISTPSGSLNDNDWRHITVTLDPTNNLMNVYLDGQAQFGSGFVMNSNGIQANANAFTAGLPQNSNNDLAGHLDDLRIFNNAITATDAAQIYASSPRWNSDTTTFDAGRDITLNDAVWADNAGDALTLSTGRDFINNSGAGALNTTNGTGRWLVYAPDSTNITDGGLVADEQLFSQANVVTALTNAGPTNNAFAYLAAAPSSGGGSGSGSGDTTIPNTVEQNLVGNTINDPSVSNTFQENISSQARALPGSQIDIEIEGLNEETKEQNDEGSKTIIKLKIDRELADELNLVASFINEL